MYGAGVAASKAGKKDVAKKYLENLLAQAKEADDSQCHFAEAFDIYSLTYI
jgi:hypothetical protein